MATSEQYRSKAAESAQLADQSKSPSDIKTFREAEGSFMTLAENEEWLAGNKDKIVSADRTD